MRYSGRLVRVSLVCAFVCVAAACSGSDGAGAGLTQVSPEDDTGLNPPSGGGWTAEPDTPTAESDGALAADVASPPPIHKEAIAQGEEPPGPHFALLGKLAARHGLSELSMGMSGDYETAILYGATHIRVGSALFGERDA